MQKEETEFSEKKNASPDCVISPAICIPHWSCKSVTTDKLILVYNNRSQHTLDLMA